MLGRAGNMANSYATILRDSERARWSFDEVVDSVRHVDFSRPFLPNSLVHVHELAFLDADGRRYANQIRAHSYVHVFALVERFILPFAMLHAGNALHSSSEELLALMQFGEEEAKHIALFERFSEAFEVGFGSGCALVSNDFAISVLAEDPLAIALATLHIEWMTQDHFLRSVRRAGDIDASYKNLLRCHWMEEAQHAKIDALLIEKAASGRSERERYRAVQGYIGILRSLERAFRIQTELDLEALERVAGKLRGLDRDTWRKVQTSAYNEAFLHAGLVHARVRDTLEQYFPRALELLESPTRAYEFQPPPEA